MVILIKVTLKEANSESQFSYWEFYMTQPLKKFLCEIAAFVYANIEKKFESFFQILIEISW